MGEGSVAAIAAALSLYSDAEHSDVSFCQIDSFDWRFVVWLRPAGRIDPTEEFLRCCPACQWDCVHLDASRAFRAGSVCVSP